jgi:hypothetical protein
MKKIRQTAKQLFALSFVENVFDEKRAMTIVNTLTKQKPLHYVQILKMYKHVIERYFASQQIIVEVPKGFSAKAVSVKSEKKLVIQENPDIVFGVRIIDGDWVYDNTLGARLLAITNF